MLSGPTHLLQMNFLDTFIEWGTHLIYLGLAGVLRLWDSESLLLTCHLALNTHFKLITRGDLCKVRVCVCECVCVLTMPEGKEASGCGSQQIAVPVISGNQGNLVEFAKRLQLALPTY